MIDNFLTLDVIADGSGERTTTGRAVTTEYDDGYKQEVRRGLKNTTSSISFAYTRYYPEAIAVESFLAARKEEGKPFWFTFYANQEPLRLYKVEGDITFKHVGGNTFVVSANFRLYEGN